MLFCPICSKPHCNEEKQALEVLKCAEKLTKRAKSARSFRSKYGIFISYLDNSNIHGLEARAYLIEFDHILEDKFNIKRQYFNAEKILIAATRMKERQLSQRVRNGEVRRPKQMCPVCLHFHFNSAEIPEKCWARMLKGDISLAHEFNNFLKENGYGEVTL